MPAHWRTITGPQRGQKLRSHGAHTCIGLATELSFERPPLYQPWDVVLHYAGSDYDRIWLM